jgi:hypothetical protein
VDKYQRLSAQGEYDAFDLHDARVGVPLDPIPVFMTMHLDWALLRPMTAMSGANGTVQYRRALALRCLRDYLHPALALGNNAPTA